METNFMLYRLYKRLARKVAVVWVKESRELYPMQRVGGFRYVGPQELELVLSRTLQALKEHCPYEYEMVCSYLNTIYANPSPMGWQGFGNQCAFIYDSTAPPSKAAVAGLAGYLVAIARISQLLDQGRYSALFKLSGARREVDELEKQVVDIITSSSDDRTGPDIVGRISPIPRTCRNSWNVIMLIYKSIDCVFWRDGKKEHFSYRMTDAEVSDAKAAMQSAAKGVFEGSGGHAHMTLTIVEVGRTLPWLTKTENGFYWPDPQATAPELEMYCSNGKADCAVVFWPSKDHGTGASVLNECWGLGSEDIDAYTMGIGYSTVSNIVSPNDTRCYPGEVIIHEWLHSVGGYYKRRFGAAIPDLDAATNYRPSPDGPPYCCVPGEGEMAFYRDFMTGKVWNPALNRYEGIRPEHWDAGPPRLSLLK